jgi:glycosyltransferase involved in cell wall biosynthesis
MNSFRVSVVIPVYNARKYLCQAVESAVTLQEVYEVILVEDGSPDNALELCRQLEHEHTKVKVYQHPGGVNRGAGASRNLGIEKSMCDFIAFLDADDWFLPNRFEKEEIYFMDDTIDGVYGATGFYFNETDFLDEKKLTTLSRSVEPENLLAVLLQSHTGRFHTDAITVRKTLLLKAGLFDTALRLHQDTHLWLRIAFLGKLVPGIIDKPISIRRVHNQNRISSQNNASRFLLYKKVFESFYNYHGVSKTDFNLILKKTIAAKSNSRLEKLLFTLKLVVLYPGILKKIF